MTTHYSAVIFDMDGTLLDTLEDLAAAVNGAMAGLGHAEHPLEVIANHVGAGMENLVRCSLPEPHRDRQTFETALAATRSNYADGWDRQTHLYPRIDELLDALVQRGVKLAILSNKPHEFAVDMARRYLAAWPFAEVLGVQPGGPFKPDPALALQIAGRLGVPPRQTIFVGDSDIDIQTGLAAGMLPVGVPWGFRPQQSLWDAGAAALLQGPLDLLSMLMLE